MKTKNLFVSVVLFALLGSVARSQTLGEALDAPQLTWDTGGDAPWFGQAVTTRDGTDAAQSGALPNSYQSSWLETTVTGRVAVAFWWKLDNADTRNYTFYLLTNNAYANYWYGVQDWSPSCVAFDSGTNQVRWSYNNSSSDPSTWGGNRAWLDEVVVTNITGLKPVFFTQPPPALVAPEGYPDGMNLNALVVGDIPMTYQWQRSLTNLNEEWPVYNVNSPALILYPRTEAAGEYRLVASNAWGMATSAVCTVSVVPAKPFIRPHEPPDTEIAVGVDYNIWLPVFGDQPRGYQWFTNGAAIPSATNQHFNFSPAAFTDSGAYSLMVTNSYGAWTSRVAQITVSSNLPIIAAWTPGPDLLEAGLGVYVLFMADATGPQPLTYSWRKVGDVAEVSSYNNLSFSEVYPTNSGLYYFIVTNNNGAVTSRVSVLAVSPVTLLGVALDAPQQIITNDLNYNEWTVDLKGTNAHDGWCAARSPEFGDEAWGAGAFSTVVTGPINVSFWWRISAIAQAYLDISVDGSVSHTISGETAWQQQLLDLPAGEHKLTWTYRKETTGSAGQNVAWVDQFTLGVPSGGNPNEVTNFTTGGDAVWFTQTTNTHDGVGAWQSGAIGDGEVSSLETTVTGPGTLDFWWAVESEAGGDLLEFSLDGGTVTNLTGLLAWRHESFALSGGVHTLLWSYSKNGSLAEPRDAGWVDDVIFTPAPPVPTLELALNVTNLTFTTGGDAPWWIETTNSHDGVMALQSGTIGDNQKSWLRTTVSGPGTLTFWFALSTEVSQDNFYDPWFGHFDYTSGGSHQHWEQETLNVPAGIWTLEWRYEKDASGSGGSDAVWVDQVVWTPSEVPRVTVGSQWKYPGETCGFTGSVTGNGPLSFQWYREGIPISGATATALAPFTATYANAGLYELVASNYAGFGTNSAKLVVAPIFYQVTDLGALWAGDVTSYANGANSRGDVVGHCLTNANQLGHAWVWAGDVLSDLGDALGGGDSQAYAINDQGDIVGTARVPGTTNYNAIRWRKVGANYVVDDLGRNGWPYAYAQNINNAGDIILSTTDHGLASTAPPSRGVFLWRQGTPKPLGALHPAWAEDFGDAYGWGLNSVGQIVGTANAIPPSPGENALKRGWFFNGSWRLNAHDAYSIGSLPGVTGTIDSSGVYAVNDYGDLAGQYIRSIFGAMGCFVTSGTNAVKISGWYSYFQGLNNHGDLLANDDGLRLFCSTNATAPARLPDGRPDYSDHAWFAVEDLVAGGLGTFVSLGPDSWTYSQLSEARAIVGSGVTTNGAHHAFLAQPVARPGNNPPVQTSPLIVTNYGSTLIFPIARLLATCPDADGDPLALVAADGQSGSLATIRRSGNYLLYTPPASTFTDPDSFQGTVLDYHGGQIPVTVIVRNWPSLPPPAFEHLAVFRHFGLQPFVRFFATPGQTWRLEYSDTAAPGSWTTIVTFVVGPEGLVDFTDNALLVRPRRFYRAASP